MFVLRSEGILPAVGALRVEEAVSRVRSTEKKKIYMVKLINKEENSQPEQIVDLNPCVIKPLSESAAASPPKKLPRMREFNLSFLLFCFCHHDDSVMCSIYLFIYSAAGSSVSFSWTPVSPTEGKSP